jgi:hypothetical protein
MAYYADINLVANDTKPEINLTLKDSNTAATGLTLDPDDSATWKVIDISEKFWKRPRKTTNWPRLGGSPSRSCPFFAFFFSTSK